MKPRGSDGPIIGIRYTRVFGSISEFGGPHASDNAENTPDAPPIAKLGDALDIGLVRMYAYSGTWKQAAAWIRKQRSDIPFRTSPATWYNNTTFVSEGMGDDMVKKGLTFYDYPKVLAEEQRLGSDLFLLPSFRHG